MDYFKKYIKGAIFQNLHLAENTKRNMFYWYQRIQGTQENGKKHGANFQPPDGTP